MKRRPSLVLFLLIVAAVFVHALDRQPNETYRTRRMELAEKAKGGVVILFAKASDADLLYGFQHDLDFYYLTGWNEPGAALLIAGAQPASDNAPARPYTEIFFLPNHNRIQERWTGPKLGPEDPKAPAITGFDKVMSLDKLADAVTEVTGGRPTRILSTPPDPRSQEPNAATVPLDWLRRNNALMGPVGDAHPLVAELREVKDQGELDRILKATDASKAAHRAAFKAMKPGMTEHQIAALMTYEFEMRGCERPAYAPIVGSGFNSTVLHYSENSKTIDPGDLVVMDVAGEYAGYASDITRTVPATGKFTPRQREIYDVVLGAQRAAQEAFVAGKSTLFGKGPDSLYSVVVDYMNTHGKDLHGQPLGKYFIHGLGHPVGLEVHDVGTNTTMKLDKGMVFTIEPGIYIPEEKLGVRIEDIYYVDQNGKLVDMTADLPHTADEVEAAMAQGKVSK